MHTKGTTSYRIGNQNAPHYLTITTVCWIDLFTRRRNKEILTDSLRFCMEKKGLELYCYCIMTNHVHLICRATEGYKLSDILRDFKRHTAKYLLNSIMEEPESRRKWILKILESKGGKNRKNEKYQVWRQDNHPIELYSNPVIDQKINYIHNNPVVEQIVLNPEDYYYSSARNFANLEAPIEIDFL